MCLARVFLQDLSCAMAMTQQSGNMLTAAMKETFEEIIERIARMESSLQDVDRKVDEHMRAASFAQQNPVTSTWPKLRGDVGNRENATDTSAMPAMHVSSEVSPSALSPEIVLTENRSRIAFVSADTSADDTNSIPTERHAKKQRVKIVSCGYANHSSLRTSAQANHQIFHRLNSARHATITDATMLRSLRENFPSMMQQPNKTPYCDKNILILDCRNMGGDPAHGRLNNHVGLHPDMQEVQWETRACQDFFADVVVKVKTFVESSAEDKIIFCACRSGNHRGVMTAEWTKTGLQGEGYDVTVEHLTRNGGGWKKKCSCDLCHGYSHVGQERRDGMAAKVLQYWLEKAQSMKVAQ